MRFLCIGCVHGKVPKEIKRYVKDHSVDAILCCGDIANTDVLRDLTFASGKIGIDLRMFLNPQLYKKILKDSIKSMQPVMLFFNHLSVPVFLVLGNNDYVSKEANEIGLPGIEKLAGKNVRILKNEIVPFQDVSIAGLSLFRDVIEKTQQKSTSGTSIKKFFRSIKNPEKTIVVTHDVPYKIFDKVLLKESPAFGMHVGEPVFNHFLTAHAYIGHVCAHMHEYQGEKKVGKTSVITTGYGREGKWALIEIEQHKIRKLTFVSGGKKK